MLEKPSHQTYSANDHTFVLRVCYSSDGLTTNGLTP